MGNILLHVTSQHFWAVQTLGLCSDLVLFLSRNNEYTKHLKVSFSVSTYFHFMAALSFWNSVLCSLITRWNRCHKTHQGPAPASPRGRLCPVVVGCVLGPLGGIHAERMPFCWFLGQGQYFWLHKMRTICISSLLCVVFDFWQLFPHWVVSPCKTPSSLQCSILWQGLNCPVKMHVLLEGCFSVTLPQLNLFSGFWIALSTMPCFSSGSPVGFPNTDPQPGVSHGVLFPCSYSHQYLSVLP